LSTPTAVAQAPIDLGCAALTKPTPTRGPDPTIPPPPNPTIGGSDSESVSAIRNAAGRLATLGSYQFSVDVVGRDLGALGPSALDFGLRGTLSRANGLAVDTLIGTRMRETNGTGAAVSGSSRYVVGGGYLWATDNVSDVLEPIRAESTVSGILNLMPDAVAGRLVVPFAGGFKRIGTETHGGIRTVHFRASTRGAAAYAAALHFDGDIKADLWIASDGGHLAAATIEGTGGPLNPNGGPGAHDGLLLAFEVTNADDPGNTVELPVAPVADPVRPSGPPVDLQLVYQVMPTNGASPTPTDLDEIGVTLRYRLDVSARPVRVNVEGTDRLVVTICNTTHPQDDRRLVLARGALTVVPLPASDYGSTTKAGSKALPAVGGSIDPGLVSLAPAAGVGLTTAHVDPTTGRRGLAFLPSNQAADTVRQYAAAHRGEYIAVVLDGVVLAVLPIDEHVVKAHFAFTGDYTEAESHQLAQTVYRDPLPFELRPIEEIEVPSTGS
jgi:hypothetical protein